MNRKVNSIQFNYVMNMILTIATILFPIISFPYVSRVLGPDGVGRVSFAMSIVSYFSMIAQLGIPTYGIRECAKLRDDKERLSEFVKEIIVINIIICVITYVLFFAFLFSVERFRTEKVLFICMSCAILFNSMGLEWLYKGLEEYGYITKRSVFFKLIAFIGMFVLIKTEADVLEYGILTIFASVGSNFCNWINVKKLVSIKGVKVNSLKRHMRPIVVFFMISIATTIYTNLDNVMLGFMTNDNEVGFYTAATKVKAALVSIVASLGTVLLPRASYYIEQKWEAEFFDLSKKSMEFTMIIALPLTVYFTEFARETILVLSGNEYMHSVPVMIALMPTIVFIGATNIIGMQILVPMGREKLFFFSVLGGAVVDFLVNYFLIPLYGAFGAAIGTTVAEFIVFLIQWIGYRSNVTILFNKLQYWKYCIGLIIGFLLSYFVLRLEIHDFLKLVLSAIVFFGIYFGILLLLRESLLVEFVSKYMKKIRRKNNECKL